MEVRNRMRVFISYAWEKENDDDNRIKSFVQWLAVYLKKWNIDVLLDIFENQPGSKLDKYMRDGINNSNFVICICTETYIKKMNDSETGVYNEIMLLKEKAESPFIIPIIEKGKFINLPSFFKGKFVSELVFSPAFSKENKEKMFELINTLRDEKLSIRDISVEDRIENYYMEVDTLKLRAKIEQLMSFDIQIENIITFKYLQNDGDFTIGLSPMKFVTHWSTAGSESIYSYNKVQKMFHINNFKEFSIVKKPSDIPRDSSTCVDWATTLKIGDGIVWINHDNHIAIGKILNINLDNDNEYQSEVTLEYRILNPVELSDDFIQDVDVDK